MSENVKIDKYVLVTEKSPKVIVFDNSIQRNIVSVNTLSDEHNLALAEMILAELNTGKYEPVEDDTPIDTVSPAETDDNDGAVEPDVNNDIGSDTGDTDGDDEDLGNG